MRTYFWLFLCIISEAANVTYLGCDELDCSLQYFTFEQQLTFRKLGTKYNTLFNYHNAGSNRNIIDDIIRLQNYSFNIGDTVFNANTKKDIKAIADTHTLNPIYRQKLFNILKNAYLNAAYSHLPVIGLTNLQTFMHLLNIHPITTHELSNDNFMVLPLYSQLLLIFSRIIAHPFIFAHDVVKVFNAPLRTINRYFADTKYVLPYYYRIVKPASAAEYIVFRTIYDFAYSFVSRKCMHIYPSNLNDIVSLNRSCRQMRNLHYLQDKFYFVAWNLPETEASENWPRLVAAYKKIVHVTFFHIFRDDTFPNQFLSGMHVAFVLKVLENHKVNVDAYSNSEEFATLVIWLKKAMQWMMLQVDNRYDYIVEKVVRLLYQRNGIIALQHIVEFDLANDKGYYYVLMSLLLRIDGNTFGNLYNPKKYALSENFNMMRLM